MPNVIILAQQSVRVVVLMQALERLHCQVAVVKKLSHPTFHPDMFIIDPQLLRQEVHEAVPHIKVQYPTSRVILISEKDYSLCELQADDLLSARMSLEEVVYRVKRWLWVYTVQPSTVLSCKEVTIHPEQRYIACSQGRLKLRPREFSIFFYLYQHRNSVVTRDQLISRVWGESVPLYSTIDSYIGRIRTIMGNRIPPIKTIWGVGYVLQMNE